jgi:HlyD family secretion protein
MVTTAAPLDDKRPKSASSGAGVPSGLGPRLTAGVVISALLLVAVFGWAAVAQLSGAVIATGVIVIDNNSKKVQHPQGGVIGEIFVKNGDRVAAGDLLIRLDETQIRASFAIVRTQLIEALGRKARLMAERDDAGDVIFPDELPRMGAEAANMIDGEQRLFRARRTLTSGQKAQIEERIKQAQEEIKGLTIQHEAKGRELALIRAELSRVSELFKKSLIPITRMMSLQREETHIDGESGAVLAQIAKLGGQIAEQRLQISSIDQTKFSDAHKELRETDARIAELQEKKIAIEDQLKRINLRAPMAGVVHELNVHTVGGVIGPAEQLLLIVPSDDILSVETRVAAPDISQIRIGQSASLRFPAFNQRTTPEAKGVVTRSSPDVSVDSHSGQSYYTVRISLGADVAARLDGQSLIPGMPVEAFIETEPRNALSYLIKPLTDQFRRAFRER